jgi:glyoxylase I family protein
LDANGVSHSGIIDVGYGSTVVFRDPDNVQLEFFVHPNPADMTLTDADSQKAKRLLYGEK